MHFVFRVQLAVCVSHLVKQEFPHKWTAIIDKIAHFLRSQQTETWLGSLMCMYQLIKAFE